MARKVERPAAIGLAAIHAPAAIHTPAAISSAAAASAMVLFTANTTGK
jgi:hypothetical protein